MTTQDRLEQIARDYHAQELPDKFIEDLTQEATVEWIASALEGRERIAELGYGEGLVTRGLLQQGKQVTVIEGSEQLALAAREAQPAATVVHSLFEEYRPPRPFEAVVASHILEHVEDPVRVLKSVAGWLAPGGRVCIVVPNSESLHRRLAVRMGLQPRLDSLSPRDHLVGHLRVYSLAGLRAHLEQAGLKVTATRGFFLKPLANSQMLGHSRELLRAMNEISAELPPELMANLGLIAEP